MDNKNSNRTAGFGYTQRVFQWFLVLALLGFSCTRPKSQSVKYSFQKIEYKKLNESFDSTFVLKGDTVRLVCTTETFNDFSVADTINDTMINLYQDRFLKLELTSNKIDTQIVVTKKNNQKPLQRQFNV